MSTRLLVFALVAVCAGCQARPAPEKASSNGEEARPLPHVAMPLPRELGRDARPLPASPATPMQLVVYYGGHVLSAVKVYDVNWGPNVDAMTVQMMPQFWPAVVDSPYLDWLEEYDTIGLNGQDGQGGTNQHITRGTFGKAVTITPMNQSTTLSENDISAEIAAQIAAKGLPAPDVDKDGNPIAIYMIDFPPNYSFTLLGGAGGFCAYHWSVGVNGKQVPFGVHPDINTWLGGQCKGYYTSGQIHSHELMEAITDTETGAINWQSQQYSRPAAWADNQGGGEIGDICVYMNDKDGMVGSYSVQKVWSNAAGACVDQFPVCGGANVYPNCHHCTKFDDGTLCNGTTPVCETNAMSAQLGNCVQCAQNKDCSGGKPICDTSSDTCRSCTPADCTGTKGVCEQQEAGALAGQCVQCDATHTSACKGTTPKCDTALGQCVGCLSNADCSGSTPICDGKTHACRGCTSNADCVAPRPACDTASDSSKGQCVACTASTDCPSGDACDTVTHTCAPTNDGASADGSGDDGGGNGASGGNGGSCGCRAAGEDARGGGALAAASLLALFGALRRRRRG